MRRIALVSSAVLIVCIAGAAALNFDLITQRTIDVPGNMDELIINVPPESGRWRMILNDEYASTRFAYYRLSSDGCTVPGSCVGGFVFEPITSPNVVGCQEDESGASLPNGHRNKWTVEDNADNAAGNAFASYVVEFSAPALGESLALQLNRHVKYFYPTGTGRWPGSGRYDRPRPLSVFIQARAQ